MKMEIKYFIGSLVIVAIIIGFTVDTIYDQIVIGGENFTFGSKETENIDKMVIERELGSILETVSNKINTIESVKSPKSLLASLPVKNLIGDGELMEISRDEIVLWTNFERDYLGLRQLKQNPILNQVAEQRLADMFTRSYFDHVSPTGEKVGTVATNIGYDYAIVGENLALGEFKNGSELVRAWMDSPGHRANITSSLFTEIGVASRVGDYQGQRVLIAVQVFGKPLSFCSLPNQSFLSQITENKTKINSIATSLENIKSRVDDRDYESKNEHAVLIDKYNEFAKDYNNLIKVTQATVSAYNIEVREYNKCLGN